VERNSRSLVNRYPAIIGALLLLSCVPPVPDPEPPVPPAPAPDASVPPAPEPEPAPELEACERACVRLQELGCREGEPTPAGKPCVEWFCDAANAGILDLQPECLATITDCDQVDTRCR